MRLKRVLFTLVLIFVSAFLFKPFVVARISDRGYGYLGFNLYKDAIRQYKKAIILDPKNTQIMDWLGYAYRYAGEKENAVRIYKKALTVDPHDIIAHHDLGMMYALDNKFELAKEHFLKGSAVPQERDEEIKEEYFFYNQKTLEMLSICQERLGEIQDAIETNEYILKCYPDNILAQERLQRLKKLN